MKGDIQMQAKPNTGMLMRNTRKETDKHPDLTGTWVGEDGVEYYLDAWNNVSQNGNKYLKLRLGKPKAPKQISQHSQAKANAYQPQPGDDDIPF